MPVFQITGPDGKQYRVSGENAEGAFSALQQHLGSNLNAEPVEPSPAAAPASPPDKYQQAAVLERDALKAKGIDTNAGVARRAIQGATFNLADEALAGLSTPLEMVKRGTFDPREGYRYAKAREDLILDDARKSTGTVGTVAELGGGLLSGTGLARAGVTAGRMLAPEAGILARSGASALDAGLMGAVAGAGEGNSLDERAGNAAFGGLLGAGIGGAAPGAIGAGKAALSPITSNIAARVNPQSYATRQVARAIMESGRAPQQIAQDVGGAAAAGQGMFTVADAIGNPGQRMLSTVARSPGQARTDLVNLLEGRQAGQGRRITNALAEGFDSPQTADQTETALTRARDAAANAEYGAVRNDASPVDITNVIGNIDATLGPRTAFGTNITNDTAEGALASVRSRLTDGRSNLTDFNAVQRVRGDLSDAVEAARRAGQGNRARLLGGALRELDAALEASSPGFRQANANFAQASRNIDAVGQGRNAAVRGRTEDTIPAYQQLTPEGQAAFRSGYVDPLISQAQGAAFGVNKARPLINDAFQTEAAAMAPGNPLMQQRIAREQTMFETRNHALGGSRTADNLNDDAAMGIDPGFLVSLGMGDVRGIARGLLSAGKNALTGNTPEVRAEVGRLLTMRGSNVTQQQLQGVLDEAVRRVQARQIAGMLLGRGAAGALADAPSALGNR
ncbi:hypothetical protein [Afipia carboxidovorans]|uniref:hypothetical protein n=1 Tax=Afipia carboxidovorans TaxID=40137 RepID=UPI00308919B9|nr:hypothetical protein CRBSH125_09450 [Afipia carboxidovorans]